MIKSQTVKSTAGDILLKSSVSLAWFNYTAPVNAGQCGKLTIVFRNGLQVVYDNIPEKTLRELMDTNSQCSFIMQRIVLSRRYNSSKLKDIVPYAIIKQKLSLT